MTKRSISNHYINFFESGLKKTRTFLFLLISPFLLTSQFNNLTTSLNSIPTLGFKFETKYFILEDDFSQIREFKPYLEFNKSLRFGVGYCRLKKSRGRILKFSALTFFSEYLLNFNRFWAAEIPFDFGLGRIKNNSVGFYSFFEPSFIIEYSGFRFFNLGFGTGLRLSLHDRNVYNNDLTVQTLILRFNLKFIEIFKYVRELKNT